MKQINTVNNNRVVGVIEVIAGKYNKQDHHHRSADSLNDREHLYMANRSLCCDTWMRWW